MEPWLSKIGQLRTSFASRLVTEADFSAALRSLVSEPQCPIQALELRIERAHPFRNLAFGARGIGEPAEVRRIDLFDAFGSICRIEVWWEGGGAQQALDLHTASEALLGLAQAYWKPSLRDTISWTISRQNSEREHLIDKTILHYLQQEGSLAVFYGDLDNFKAANDCLKEIEGDRIIREFAAVLEQAVGPDGILIHRSGDTYTILYPANAPHKCLWVALCCMRAVHEHDFRTADINLGIKIGIALVDKDSSAINYNDIEPLAQKATVAADGSKLRGRARLAGGLPDGLPAADPYYFDLALALLKSNITSIVPFACPWLTVISEYIRGELVPNEAGLDAERVRTAASTIISWIQPDIDSGVLTAAYAAPTPVAMPPRLSHFDLAFAVAHAVLRAGMQAQYPGWSNKSLELRYREDGHGGCLRLVPDEISLMTWGDQEGLVRCYLLGPTIAATPEALSTSASSYRAVLIKIGHSDLPVPSTLFEDVITVDDRPTRGGGLPDFWEATIARLIARTQSNPNIAAVFVFGDHRFAAKTIEKLRNIAQWADVADQIAYKTGMPARSIVAAARKLVGSVFFPSTPAELVSALVSLFREPYQLASASAQPKIPQQRYLQRDLRTEDICLRSDDGCRVKTIAEAYPIVLEIARKAAEDPVIRDQAGQELRELMDFKVHLTTPLQDLVPAFYVQERPSLEEYFEREFLAEEGIFARHFRQDDQLGAVLHHLAFALSSAPNPFCTRRAILTIPHVIQQGQDLAPLGLVSVRLVPRLLPGRRIIHFSYTWRTVEALVGFPYSLFASVRFGQHLTERLKALLPPEASRTVEMGHVSYIAHSLHIFLDAYGQNIARRIVDDASI